jgi:hypothetical protein
MQKVNLEVMHIPRPLFSRSGLGPPLWDARALPGYPVFSSVRSAGSGCTQSGRTPAANRSCLTLTLSEDKTHTYLKWNIKGLKKITWALESMVLWAVMSCSLETAQQFRRIYHLHLHGQSVSQARNQKKQVASSAFLAWRTLKPKDGGNIFLQNVTLSMSCVVLRALLWEPQV